MKKKIYVFLVNVVFLIIIILGIEFFLYKSNPESENLPFLFLASSLNHPAMSEDYKVLKNNGYYEKGNSQEEFLFRKPVGLEYKKPPIIIFGGSYAWGARLYEDQTFHYKLSELMQRPVYNRAISGWGVQHMLYQLERDDFYEDVPKPEYVIYLYISNHISRMHKYNFIYKYSRKYSYNYLKYNLIADKLIEEKKPQHIPYLRIYEQFILRYFAKINENNSKKSFDIFEKHLLACKEQMDKHWGENNVKFILLYYDSQDCFNDFPSILNEENIKKLSNDGITVIKTSDLTDIALDENYWLDDRDPHPHEKAWELITPLFVEYLNNNKQ